jgi:hypothetical protein
MSVIIIMKCNFKEPTMLCYHCYERPTDRRMPCISIDEKIYTTYPEDHAIAIMKDIDYAFENTDGIYYILTEYVCDFPYARNWERKREV